MPRPLQPYIAAGSPESSPLCGSCKRALVPRPPCWHLCLSFEHDQEGREDCHMCVQLRYTYQSGRETREVCVPNNVRGRIALGRYQTPWEADDVGYFWDPRLRSSSLFSKSIRLCALYVIKSNDRRVAGYVPIKESASTTFSSDALSHVSQWTGKCNGSHALCSRLWKRSEPDARWLPSRLLALNLHPDTVFLQDNPAWAESTRYATLSYCWGRNPSFLTLKAGRLDQMKEQGVPISTLSATFRDAIAFCKRVDIIFLWIDALCIIQDSEDDWNTEALLMSKVYRYSYLNLAATASENADGGLFYERNPFDVNLLRLSLGLGMSVRDYYLLRRPFHASPQILDGSPLNRRGWVTQERFISPRTIHFASDQLHWECPELMACEIFPAGLKWDEGFSRTLDWRKLTETSLFHQFRSGQEHPTTGQIQKIWSQLVAYYTHCQLTFPSDKLIAISGLAKIVSEISGDNGYYAGIWSTHVLSGLTWIVATSWDGTSSQYVAPSWSWASINGVIQYPGKSIGEPAAEIIDINTTPKGNDIFGQLVGGCLRLKGLLFQLEIRGWGDLHPKGCKTPFPWFWSDDEASMDRRKKRRGLDLPEKCFGLILEYSLPRPALLEGQLHRMVKGILLKPTNSQRGQYRRCGVFGTHEADDGPSLDSIAREIWTSLSVAAQSFPIASAHYEAFDGTSQYTISII